jgi:hypothetical protein
MTVSLVYRGVTQVYSGKVIGLICRIQVTGLIQVTWLIQVYRGHVRGLIQVPSGQVYRDQVVGLIQTYRRLIQGYRGQMMWLIKVYRLFHACEVPTSLLF